MLHLELLQLGLVLVKLEHQDRVFTFVFAPQTAVVPILNLVAIAKIKVLREHGPLATVQLVQHEKFHVLAVAKRSVAFLVALEKPVSTARLLVPARQVLSEKAPASSAMDSDELFQRPRFFLRPLFANFCWFMPLS